METLHISGRRWRQRVYGNTYHSVAIYVDGEHVHTAPMQYGGDEQYLWTATRWLMENGHLPKMKTLGHIRIYCEDKEDIKYTHEVADVKRERDLHS